MIFKKNDTLSDEMPDYSDTPVTNENSGKKGASIFYIALGVALMLSTIFVPSVLGESKDTVGLIGFAFIVYALMFKSSFNIMGSLGGIVKPRKNSLMAKMLGMYSDEKEKGGRKTPKK